MTEATAFPGDKHDHDACVDDALARAEALCAARGERLTPLRRRVLELVWDSHRPARAYEILDKLQEERGGAAPPTVYRALDFLLGQGLVHRIESLNAFFGCDTPEGRHGGQFLICTRCGKVAEIDSDTVAGAVKRAAAEVGFRAQRQTVEAFGLCPECAEG